MWAENMFLFAIFFPWAEVLPIFILTSLPCKFICFQRIQNVVFYSNKLYNSISWALFLIIRNYCTLNAIGECGERFAVGKGWDG